jgi:hypothetical protein
MSVGEVCRHRPFSAPIRTLRPFRPVRPVIPRNTPIHRSAPVSTPPSRSSPFRDLSVIFSAPTPHTASQTPHRLGVQHTPTTCNRPVTAPFRPRGKQSLPCKTAPYDLASRSSKSFTASLSPSQIALRPTHPNCSSALSAILI